VTRIAEFGAFVELEPGIEALAHASTFPADRARNWSSQVSVGMTAAFEIQSIDVERKRIGVAPLPEGSSRAAALEDQGTGTAKPAEGFGASLGDKLRGAIKSSQKP
jgi:ribosomal protein S1